ncbi:MAG: hypothetical protein WBW62_09930, partial [Solirubrobacterales bacterium]
LGSIPTPPALSLVRADPDLSETKAWVLCNWFEHPLRRRERLILVNVLISGPRSPDVRFQPLSDHSGKPRDPHRNEDLFT